MITRRASMPLLSALPFLWPALAAALAVVAKGKLSAGSNFPMALDEAGHRLFVGCRQPAKLLVFDTESGKETAAVD